MRNIICIIFVLCLCSFVCPAQEVVQKTSEATEAMQPMVALFGTNSFVPSLPLNVYQSCDRILGSAILSRGCRVRGRVEADQALQRLGVVRLVELDAQKAQALMTELKCVSLVQLTLTDFRLQSASRRGNRAQKNLPPILQIANIAGEIQIWSQGDLEARCLNFQRVLTDQDSNLSCVPGECDRNSFGLIALQYALDQAMQEFSK